MAEPHLLPDAISLQDAAPAINQLINSRPTRLHVSLCSSDVQGGYGFAQLYMVRVELWRSKCRLCNETEDTRRAVICTGHRFEKQWMQIAETEAPTLSVALQIADIAVASYAKLYGFYDQPNRSLVLINGAVVATA